MPDLETRELPLLPEWSAELTTRDGTEVYVRPAVAEDLAQVRGFFASLRPDDLRFRFLTLARPSEAQLDSLVNVDHVRTEDFLAFVDGSVGGDELELAGIAMLAADQAMEAAEVAIAVRPDYRNQGIGWTLLDFVAQDAAARGIKLLQSIECRDNRPTIELEEEMGFIASIYPGDPSLTLLTKRIGSARRG